MTRVRRVIIAVIMIVTAFFVFPVVRHRAYSWVTHAGALCVYPIVYLGSVFVKPLNDIYYRFQFLLVCEEEYKKLFAQYRSLIDEHTCLLAERIHTRETTPFVVRYDILPLFSRVLMRRYDTGFHRILVDYGSMAGVCEDMPVLDGFSLVGRISLVSPLYAWVQTISDPHVRIPVSIGSRGVRGIYQGTGDIKFGRVLYVSHLEAVVLGDIVLTAGDGGAYPEGFAVGRISRIEKEGFTYLLDVALLAQLESLDRCAIHVHAKVPTGELQNVSER
jgi:rod shape-determining protein MreC